MDHTIETALGHRPAEMIQQHAPGARSPLQHRVLELRELLAAAERQLADAREYLHQATAPGQDPHTGDLADALQRYAVGQYARDRHHAALTDLLRTMPPARTARPPAVTAARLPPRPATVTTSPRRTR